MAITLEELVGRFGGQLIGDGRIPVVGFAPLDNADTDHITFLTNPRLRNEVSSCKAAALIISPKDNQLVGDLFGDWREEIVTVVDGELRVYTTTIPAADRRVTFLQDPLYRSYIYNRSMGYQQSPSPTHNF